MLACAFIMPLIFCLTYLAIPGTEPQKVVYYTVMGFLFYSIFILYYVSHTALGADIADDYDDSIAMNSIVWISKDRVPSSMGPRASSARPRIPIVKNAMPG